MEFKRDDVRAENLAKEIVSFANMNGGRILLGVDDDGAISGTQRKNLQAWIMDTVIGRHIHPYIVPNYEDATIENKRIVVLTIPMGTAKPYVLKHNDREEIYVRYGDTCQLASREQQARLFESGGLISAEKFPVPGSTIDELDEQRYREYFIAILDEKSIPDWPRFLMNRNFLVDNEQSLPCSYFAYTLFAKNPRRKLPQSGARVIVYSGNEQEYQTLMDKDLSSPLVEFRGNNSNNTPAEMALHDKIIDILQPFISRESLDGTTRKRHWDYPPEALRELFVNAFIHRDWTKQNYVRIVAYSDRLEVVSPGALPNGMTIERIKYGDQSLRNSICVRIFRDYGYLEDRGMERIRRKVIPLTLAHSGREPEFEATENHFKVTLWKRSSPDS